jgi:hypothetical protein
MQKTLSGDIVSIYFLRSFYHDPTIETTVSVLSIGSTTYQGNTFYKAECYSLADGVWTEIRLPIDNAENNLAFAITDNAILHVFRTEYPEISSINGDIVQDTMRPKYEYISSYFWLEKEKRFAKDFIYDE